MFVFIGAAPRTDWLGDLVARDDRRLHPGRDRRRRPTGWPLERDPFLLETSVPGIFAAGDVRHGSIKRVASAVGEGLDGRIADPPVPRANAGPITSTSFCTVDLFDDLTDEQLAEWVEVTSVTARARRYGVRQGVDPPGLKLLLEGEALAITIWRTTARSRSAARCADLDGRDRRAHRRPARRPMKAETACTAWPVSRTSSSSASPSPSRLSTGGDEPGGARDEPGQGHGAEPRATGLARHDGRWARARAQQPGGRGAPRCGSRWQEALDHRLDDRPLRRVGRSSDRALMPGRAPRRRSSARAAQARSTR